MWYVYVLRCSDGTLYTGITNNLQARVKTHNNGKGCKYTCARRPVKLIYHEVSINRSTATKRERFVKKMPKKKKEAMVTGKSL